MATEKVCPLDQFRGAPIAITVRPGSLGVEHALRYVRGDHYDYAVTKSERLIVELRKYAIGVDPMSYHGEAAMCELCNSTWNNGRKRNDPATPEVHKATCLLDRTEHLSE